jgi:hypothetical protein
MLERTHSEWWIAVIWAEDLRQRVILVQACSLVQCIGDRSIAWGLLHLVHVWGEGGACPFIAQVEDLTEETCFLLVRAWSVAPGWRSVSYVVRRVGRSRTPKSSLVGFGGLDDNLIKGLTCVLYVEHVLSVKLVKFNTSVQMWWSKGWVNHDYGHHNQRRTLLKWVLVCISWRQLENF